MLAWPAARFAVGVKVAVRVEPVPLSEPRLPPVVTMSSESKLLPGSSLKLKVMAAVPLALTAVLLLVMVSVGAKVSILMVGVWPATPALPAASAYSPAATVMPAVPVARLGVGVKTAVRLRSVPLSALRLPPVVKMSAKVKLLPGSSLKLKLISAVSPTLTAGVLLVIASVGTSVSIVMAGAVAAAPALPATSV